MDLNQEIIELRKENSELKIKYANQLIENDYASQYRQSVTFGSLFAFDIDITTDRLLKTDISTIPLQNEKSYTAYSVLMEKVCTDQISDKDAPLVQKITSREHLLEAFSSGERQVSIEYQTKGTEDNILWFRYRVFLIQHPVSGDICGLVTIKNINSQKNHELQLIERAQHDPLTNLFNRRSLETQVQIALSEGNESHGLILMDIDNFKSYNDTYGHQFGDLVLVRFAQLLSRSFRKYDIISRIGGDEFTVFMKSTTQDIVINRAHHILSECSTLFPEKPEAHITPSIGIALYPKHGMSFAELYQKADAALYTSKAAGKARLSVYRDTTMKPESDLLK